MVLCCQYVFSQQTFLLVGRVVGEDNVPIPNAIIQFDNLVISSRDRGVFEIECSGSLALKISAIGYENLEETIDVKSDVNMDFLLKKISHDLAQVVIEEEGSKYESSKTINQINTIEIKLIPSASGVSDIFSTLKTNPGVQSNTEGQKGLIIRGGNYDQSTTYVDGVPVVGSSHLFGLLSMFQTDCIEEVNLYNGYKPVKYGGTLGPAIEINLREEFSQEVKNSGSIKSSFLSTQVQTVLSDKNTFVQLGLRNSNLFLIQGLIDNSVNTNDSKVLTPVYSFDDVSFKVSRLFKNQKLQFLHLKSFDGVDYDIDFVWEERRYFNQMSWVNEATALNWNYYSPGGATIFAEFMVNTYNSDFYTYNRIPFYDSELGEKIWRNSISEFDNTIDNLKSTLSLENKYSKGRLLQVGLQYKNTTVTPSSYEFWEDDPILEDQIFTGNRDVVTYTGFAEFSGDLFANSSFIWGCRANIFNYDGVSEVHINPRFLFKTQMTSRFGFNFYSLMSSQDVHLVTLNSFGFIPELWLAPNEALPVERSWISGLKFNYIVENTTVFLDAYLRGMSGLLEFSENVDFNETTSEIVDHRISGGGQGAVVGLEFSLKSSINKFKYNLSYAYGRSSRLFDDLNGGMTFPFAFDIRHDGCLVLGYDISEKLSVSTLYTYSTGRMLNISNELVPIGFTTPLGGAYSQWVVYNQPLNRNGYRLGDIHRLDFNISWRKNVHYGRYHVQLGAYNVTNHVNPNSAILTYNEDGSQTIEEVGLIPILPNLTISLEWN